MSNPSLKTVSLDPLNLDTPPPVDDMTVVDITTPKLKAPKVLHAMRMSLLGFMITFGILFAASTPNLVQAPKLMMAGGEAAFEGQVQVTLSAVMGLLAALCGLVGFTLIPRAETTLAKQDELLRLAKTILFGARRHGGDIKVSLTEMMRMREMLATFGISLGDLQMHMLHRREETAPVTVKASAQIQHIQMAFRSETGMVVSYRPGMKSEIRETEVVDGTRLDIVGNGLLPSYSRLVKGNGTTGWRVIFARGDWREMAKFFFGLDEMFRVATQLGLDLDYGKLQIKLYEPSPGEPRETLVIIPRNGANEADILKYSAGGTDLPPLIKLAGDEYTDALRRLVDINTKATSYRTGTVREWLGVKVGRDGVLRRDARPPEGWPDEDAPRYGGWGGC